MENTKLQHTFVILDRPNRRLHKIMLVQDNLDVHIMMVQLSNGCVGFENLDNPIYKTNLHIWMQHLRSFGVVMHPIGKLYVIQVVDMLAIFWIRPNWTIPCRRIRPCLNERMGVV